MSHKDWNGNFGTNNKVQTENVVCLGCHSRQRYPGCINRTLLNTHTHTGWYSGWMNRLLGHRHQCCWRIISKARCFFCKERPVSCCWTSCIEAASCERVLLRFLEDFLGRWGHREAPRGSGLSRKGRGWKTFNSGSVTCWEEAIVLLEFPFSLCQRNFDLDVLITRHMAWNTWEGLFPFHIHSRSLMTALIGLYNTLYFNTVLFLARASFTKLCYLIS